MTQPPQQPGPNYPGYGQQYPGYPPQQPPQQPQWRQPQGPPQQPPQQPQWRQPQGPPQQQHQPQPPPPQQWQSPQPPAQPHWQGGGYGPPPQPGYPPQQQGYPPLPQQAPPGGSRKTIILIVVAALVVVGGGLGVYFGFFNGTSAPKKAPGPTVSALGDPSTLDPCSVVSADAFKSQSAPANGNVTTPVAIFPYSFSACEVQIIMKNNENITVDFNNAQTFAEKKVYPDKVTTTSSGSWHLVAPKDTSDSTNCTEWTYQNQNGLGFEVDAYPADSSGDSSSQPSGPTPDGPALCGIAHFTVGVIATAMQKGTFKHLNYGPGSLAPTVGCQLLSPADAGSALGVAGVKAEKSFNGHECTWDNGPASSNQPYAYFVPYLLQKAPDSSNAQVAFVGNHAAVVTPIQQQTGDTLVGCTVQTPAKEWPKWPGTIVVANPGTLYEYATIAAYVTGSDPTQACTAAKQMAQVAFAKLPAGRK